jgi:transcriptional regulator with XRE-family HTH domain
MNNNKIFLAEAIRREMKNRDISLTELSEETGIAKSTLHGWSTSAIPNGRNLHLVNRLCEYFKISLEELLFSQRTELSEDIIIFNTEFKDGEARYRFIVEKVCKNNKK